MQIDFIVSPDIRTADFARTIKTFFGIDCAARGLAAPTFLQNLAQVKDIDYDALNPGHLLRHLSYSVLVKSTASQMTEVQSETCLASLRLDVCLDDEVMLILSGNLIDFRSEVINGCSESSSKGFRTYTTKLLLLLDKQGLGQMFNAYSRKIRPNTNELILVK